MSWGVGAVLCGIGLSLVFVLCCVERCVVSYCVVWYGVVQFGLVWFPVVWCGLEIESDGVLACRAGLRLAYPARRWDLVNWTGGGGEQDELELRIRTGSRLC